MSDSSEQGVWRTIDGTHVLIKDGKVVEGPDALKGKTHAEAHEHQAKARDREAGYSRTAAADAKKKGDSAGVVNPCRSCKATSRNDDL